MKSLSLLFIVIYFFAIGCSETSQNDFFLEYSTLPELTLSKVSEIGESDNFLPGRLQDLIIAEDGSFIVSDFGSVSIIQFNSNGLFKRDIAEKGNGPGELNTFFTLIDSKRDTLLVKFFGMSMQTDVYTWDEPKSSFFYDYSFNTEIENNRLINIIEPAPGLGYFAKIEDLSQNRKEELVNPPAYNSESLVLVDSSAEIVIDSLHVLQTPNTIFVEADGGAVTPLGVPPFLSKDHVKYVDERMYIVAKPAAKKIQVFDHNHEIQNEIILHVKERPVSEYDLDNELKNIPEQFQNELRERASSVKPAFIDVWASDNHFLLYTDDNEQGKEMVLLTRDGEPVGKFHLSDFDEVREFKNQKIFSLHKDQESGHSVRVYEFM